MIRAPYAGLIRSTTRFWDTSGFTFSLSAQGAEIDFSSLATLISGGVAFETVASGGQSAQAGTTFILYPDEQAARASFFSEGAGPVVNLTVLFEENVAGLTVGSPVTYGGVIIGEVANLTGLVDPDAFGDERVRLLATLAIRPGRLGIEGGEEAALEFLAERVGEGLRAQLQTASILTGGSEDRAGGDARGRARGARPRRAAVPAHPLDRGATSPTVTATAQGVVRAGERAADRGPDSGRDRVPEQRHLACRRRRAAARGRGRPRGFSPRCAVSSARTRSRRSRARWAALLADLRGATSDLRAVVADLREADVIARALTAIEAAEAAAEAVAATLDGAPDLVASLTETADAARALPLEPLLARLTELAAAAEAVAASEDTQAIPAELRALLADARGSAADLRRVMAELAAADAVNRTLAAIDAAAAAAADLETGMAGLPDLIAGLTRVAAQAENLPLDELLEEVTVLADAANALIASEDALALPADLRRVLAELSVVAQNAGSLTQTLTEEQAAARLLAAVDAAGDDRAAASRRAWRACPSSSTA